MKTNYETPLAELGYSKDYQQFLFDRLGLLGNMEDFKNYAEQGFLNIEEYAVYKLSQMSVNELVNHMLDVIDVLEYEIDQLEQHQKQIKGEKMNKYQEALKWFQSIHDVLGQEQYYEDLGMRFGQGLHESLQTIKELVDRATPKKHIDETCPNCRKYSIYSFMGTRLNYCDNCGQKLDWSEDE